MAKLNFKQCAAPASMLAILLAASGLACSKGSDSGDMGTAGTTPITTGSAGSTPTGAAGSTPSGSAGATGTAGSVATGAAGSVATGAAGAVATGAAGDTGTTLPDNPNSVCHGLGTRPLTVDQGAVDNFETDPISPGWSSFNNLAPAAPDNSVLIKREAGGAVGTGFFGHYMGTGAKTPTMGGFGVGTIYNMAIDHTAMIACVDVTAFDGVTFWAKAGTAGAKVGVNFVVPETNMTPDGDCTTGCYNHPQKLVTLTTEWAQYSVPFASATGGTGAKVHGRVQELGWLSPDSTWDFSIDEIQLYKGTPPAGPVMTATTN